MGNYIFLGPPGAGKGTMAAMLAEKYGFAHISSGDILRAELKAGTELGKKAKSYIDQGQLVPDEVVAAIVSGRLTSDDVREKGFILDGYPRTVVQAELLDGALKDNALSLDSAVLFRVGRDLLLKRLTGRRVCRECGAVYHVLFNPPNTAGVCDKCGGPLYQRSDDRAETVEERLKVYEAQTAPLITFYRDRGLLLEVVGDKEKNENFAVLCEALGL